MKKIITLLLVLTAVVACKNEDGPYELIVGTWQLAEVLADPGDGSGVYEPVTSDKKLTFYSDGTFIANQDMCGSIGNSTTDLVSGTYDLNDSTLTLLNCPVQGSEEPQKLDFDLEGTSLTISYPCIEPCGEKYEKILRFD